MLGENIMLINQEEMRRACTIYMAKILDISEEKLIKVSNVRACKYGNKKMFEVRLTQQTSLDVIDEGNPINERV